MFYCVGPWFEFFADKLRLILWSVIFSNDSEDDDQIGAFLDAIQSSNLEEAGALIGATDDDLSDEEGAVMALLGDVGISAGVRLCFNPFSASLS
mgnify:CR=1 FL=1